MADVNLFASAVLQDAKETGSMTLPDTTKQGTVTIRYDSYGAYYLEKSSTEGELTSTECLYCGTLKFMHKYLIENVL